MKELLFEWDEKKNSINKKKHGVSFEEAKTVFDDDKAVLFDDPDHSEDEDRFLILGFPVLKSCVSSATAIVKMIMLSGSFLPERLQNPSQVSTMNTTEVNVMREEYDIKNLNPRKNPYSKQLKRQVTMNINVDTIDYFKSQSEETGIPYQKLMNLYLTDCAKSKKKISISWN